MAVLQVKINGVWTDVQVDVPAPAAPANMLTTDTPQTVPATAAKSFEIGAILPRDVRAQSGQALLLRSSAGVTRQLVNSSGVTLFSGNSIDGGGVNVLGVADATTIPTTNPAAGIVVYSEAGVLKYRDPAGNVRVLDGATGSGGAAANMVTTDTAQTITGAKTFGEGKLIMTSPVGTGEPYSDANPPNTLMMTHQGENNVAIPPTGFATLFVKRKTRSLLSVVGQSGLDTTLQPNLFSNRIAIWNAVANSAVGTQNGVAFTEITAGAAVPLTNTNFFGHMVRERFATTATAGIGTGIRTAVAQWTRSTTRNAGGFFFVARFGLNAVTATNRVFIGLHSATTAIGNVNPSTLLNMCGLACDAAAGTFSFMTNDGVGTATSVPLGANFPANASGSVAFYEVRMFCPPGDGTNAGSITWSMERLDIAGAYTEGVATTDLPTAGTFLASHLWHQNGTTAAIASIDIQSVYIETDN